MIDKPKKPLRRGWTTGACALAATKAAYTALLTGSFPDPIGISLPKGQRPFFPLAFEGKGKGYAQVGIVKDAGDDPDVTHGALIVVTVREGAMGNGVSFQAGEGVGTVTLPGLPLAVGEPAINPKPREMIKEAVSLLAAQHGHSGNIVVEVSVPDGVGLAEKTWNGRLGIEGGLSILGTTGIVRPFSCSAWIHSIHRGIDVALANGFEHVAGATGKTSESAVQKLLKLSDYALIDMGDFAGGMLKYLRDHPIPRLTIAGGFAKLTKLGQGFLDLHSGRSQVDFDWLANGALSIGGGDRLVEAIRNANTANHALEISQKSGLALGNYVAFQATETAKKVIEDSEVSLNVLVFDREGSKIGTSDA
jgi:cobalt-precorrin-5B (C1)-methyltransferase